MANPLSSLTSGAISSPFTQLRKVLAGVAPGHERPIELTIGEPRPLFRAPMPGNLDDFRNQYVVAKDGKRFLIVTVADNEPLQAIQVIFNWTALLPS